MDAYLLLLLLLLWLLLMWLCVQRDTHSWRCFIHTPLARTQSLAPLVCSEEPHSQTHTYGHSCAFAQCVDRPPQLALTRLCVCAVWVCSVSTPSFESGARINKWKCDFGRCCWISSNSVQMCIYCMSASVCTHLLVATRNMNGASKHRTEECKNILHQPRPPQKHMKYEAFEAHTHTLVTSHRHHWVRCIQTHRLLLLSNIDQYSVQTHSHTHARTPTKRKCVRLRMCVRNHLDVVVCCYFFFRIWVHSFIAITNNTKTFSFCVCLTLFFFHSHFVHSLDYLQSVAATAAVAVAFDIFECKLHIFIGCADFRIQRVLEYALRNYILGVSMPFIPCCTLHTNHPMAHE